MLTILEPHRQRPEIRDVLILLLLEIEDRGAYKGTRTSLSSRSGEPPAIGRPRPQVQDFVRIVHWWKAPVGCDLSFVVQFQKKGSGLIAWTVRVSGDVASVGGPYDPVHSAASVVMSQLFQPAAVGTDRPDFEITAAIGIERNPTAVRRPTRHSILI